MTFIPSTEDELDTLDTYDTEWIQPHRHRSCCSWASQSCRRSYRPLPQPTCCCPCYNNNSEEAFLSYQQQRPIVHGQRAQLKIDDDIVPDYTDDEQDQGGTKLSGLFFDIISKFIFL